MDWVYNDGGRKAAGYKGNAGDCGPRAIAIATGMSYQDAYELVDQHGATERASKRRNKKSSARTGTYTATFRRIMDSLNWQWTPTKFFGEGCKVHMKKDELPGGTIILRVSKHFCAVINGVVQDTHCDHRNGTRCVYGYWSKR
jgi:hypothetical protein